MRGTCGVNIAWKRALIVRTPNHEVDGSTSSAIVSEVNDDSNSLPANVVKVQSRRACTIRVCRF